MYNTLLDSQSGFSTFCMQLFLSMKCRGSFLHCFFIKILLECR